MAKSKKKQKKIGSLVLLLFLSIILLSTSTYAWFTANKTVKVSDINVNVSAVGGIQISTDAVNWKTLLQNGDITKGYTYDTDNKTDKNQLPAVLEAVSTDGELTGGYLNMFKGTVSSDSAGDFVLSAEKVGESKGTTGSYVAFDFFLKAEKDMKVLLDIGSGAKADEVSEAKGLQYATRMAFIEEGHAASESATTLLGTMGGTSATIYEPNYNGHTTYGVQQANLYYSKTLGGKALSAGLTNDKIATHGVKAAIASENAIKLAATNATDSSAYFAPVETVGLSTAFVKNESGATVEVFKTKLLAGVTKFRVYMWIEGQDVDCENNASGSNIIFSISLSEDVTTEDTGSTD